MNGLAGIRQESIEKTIWPFGDAKMNKNVIGESLFIKLLYFRFKYKGIHMNIMSPYSGDGQHKNLINKIKNEYKSKIFMIKK